MDWDESFIGAKYHLAVTERMLRNYVEVGDKRFLIGIINEAARSVSFLIRAFIIREKSREKWKNVLLKYIDSVTCENLFKMLEIREARKSSPIEYAKGDKIILLIRGKYRILTADRIREFVKSIEDGIKFFNKSIRQV